MDTNPHLWHLNSLHTSLLNSLLLLCCNSNVWIEKKKQTSLYLLSDTVNDTKIPCMCAVYAKDYASVCAKGYAKVIRVKLCSQSYAGSGDAQPALPFRWLKPIILCDVKMWTIWLVECWQPCARYQIEIKSISVYHLWLLCAAGASATSS